MDIPAIGEMRALEVARRLEACGETELAKKLIALGSDDKLSDLIASGRWRPNPWEYTEFSCAYLPPDLTPEGWGYLSDAKSITPDSSLIGSNLKITLDQLRVYRYPGGGTHNILFDFSAYHQEATQAPATPVHFSQAYRAQDNEGAGVSGYPIFNGLCVAPNGVGLSCTITNVSNQNDQQFLSFLNTDVFNKGLGFVNAVNPGLPVITGYAVSVLKAFLSRNENIKIQSFDLGLDFSTTVTSPKLRVGSYVVAQAPQDAIHWNQWVWDPGLGRIRWWDNNGVLEYNYVIFGVTRSAT